jgi:hypothetical protein
MMVHAVFQEKNWRSNTEKGEFGGHNTVFVFITRCCLLQSFLCNIPRIGGDYILPFSVFGCCQPTGTLAIRTNLFSCLRRKAMLSRGLPFVHATEALSVLGDSFAEGRFLNPDEMALIWFSLRRRFGHVTEFSTTVSCESVAIHGCVEPASMYSVGREAARMRSPQVLLTGPPPTVLFGRAASSPAKFRRRWSAG